MHCPLYHGTDGSCCSRASKTKNEGFIPRGVEAILSRNRVAFGPQFLKNAEDTGAEKETVSSYFDTRDEQGSAREW